MTPPMPDPNTTPRNVWRVQYLTREGVAGPFHDFLQSAAPPTGLTVTTSHCVKDPSHAPPEADCWCGVYACDDVRSLLTVCKAAEFSRAHSIVHQRDSMAGASRVMIVRGTLTNAVSAARPGGGKLVPMWSDGTVGLHFRDMFEGAPPERTVIGLGVRGDPPGTWRASAFTATGPAVVQSDEGDDLDLYATILDGLEHHLIEESGTPSLLSSVLQRFIASGRDDEQWWTA